MAKPGKYDVGYGKPPASGRFQKGRSGNPSGRPTGARTLEADLHAELMEEVQVTEGGRPVKLTKQRLMVKSMVAKAIKGHVPAAVKIMELQRASALPTDHPTGEDLSQSDEEIVAAYLARRGGGVDHET